jgi:hypothetical protein
VTAESTRLVYLVHYLFIDTTPLSAQAFSMQSSPRLAPKLRKEDDPKVIGLWKIGRTIGKGSSGTIAFTTLLSPAESSSQAAYESPATQRRVNTQR